MEKKEIVVSGIRSTGHLHLGNYLGAIHNYKQMQDDYDCYFFVADYHSLTTHPDAKEMKQSVFRVVAENIASGIDPEKACLYVQSDLPETAELYLLLNMLAYKGELERVPTFKDKVRQHPENVNAGLLTYPVLMAADILIHKATKVPVGNDQDQHLEMARNFANRFNHRYGDLFPEPFPFRQSETNVRVMGLDGEGKMSKSENENATIFLSDSDDTILRKIKRAKTDSGPTAPNMDKPDYIQNLFNLLEVVSTPDVFQQFEKDYNECAIRYGDFKGQLAEDMIKFISPIREKAAALQRDEAQLQKILNLGAEKARESARKTVEEARRLIGLNYK